MSEWTVYKRVCVSLGFAASMAVVAWVIHMLPF